MSAFFNNLVTISLYQKDKRNKQRGNQECLVKHNKGIVVNNKVFEKRSYLNCRLKSDSLI